MRTDSTRLSTSFSLPALEYVKNTFGKEYPIWAARNGKNGLRFAE